MKLALVGLEFSNVQKKTSSFLGHPQTPTLHSLNYYRSLFIPVHPRTISAHEWLCAPPRLILDDGIGSPQSDSFESLESSVRLPIDE